MTHVSGHFCLLFDICISSFSIRGYLRLVTFMMCSKANETLGLQNDAGDSFSDSNTHIRLAWKRHSLRKITNACITLFNSRTITSSVPLFVQKGLLRYTIESSNRLQYRLTRNIVPCQPTRPSMRVIRGFEPTYLSSRGEASRLPKPIVRVVTCILTCILCIRWSLPVFERRLADT